MSDFREFELVGGSYLDDTKPYHAQDCVNWIPERSEVSGGQSNSILRTAPGRATVFTGSSGVCRGLRNVEGALYAVIGTNLVKINSDYTSVTLGTIAGSGRVSMTHNQRTNGNQIVIVTGPIGYVYDTVTSTLSTISDESYEGGLVCAYLNSYILQVSPTRKFWFHSDLADAFEYNSIDTYQGESNPDSIVSLLVDHGEVWLFSERSIDIFINSVSENSAFERSSGSGIELGCASTFSPAKLDNSIFWLGNDGIVYRANGYNPQRISTHAIEQAIIGLDWSKAYSFTYEDRGHKIYYLTFPDGYTWGYDVATGLWHRRKTYGYNNWTVSHAVFWNNKWIVGDETSAVISELNWDTYLDNGNPIERYRATGVLSNAQNWVRINAAQVVASVGTSATGNDDHVVEMCWSDDGGYNFTNWQTRDCGAVGIYGKRLIWRRLGLSRHRVFKIRCTSPVKVDLMAAGLQTA